MAVMEGGGVDVKSDQVQVLLAALAVASLFHE